MNSDPRDKGRYVRSYWLKDHTVRWALWEWCSVKERYRRVGTAYTEDEYRAFLGV